MKKFFIFSVVLLLFSCGKTSHQHSNLGQIIDENNLEVIENVKGTPYYEFSQSIGMAILGTNGCTSVRIATDLFMTNNHCYEGTLCSQTTFTMNYERDMPETQRFKFKCVELVKANSDLDYAIYRVAPAPNQIASDPMKIAKLSKTKPTVGEKLILAGFPFGYEFMRIDRSENCKVTDVDQIANVLSYGCDTDSGSSGSPVFSRQTGEVIALHFGFAEEHANNGHYMFKIIQDSGITF